MWYEQGLLLVYLGIPCACLPNLAYSVTLLLLYFRRQSLYQGTPRNIYRHIIVSGVYAH